MTERAIDTVQLTKNEIVELFKPAFSHLTFIDHYELLSGGQVNTSYKVTIANTSYVLRLYTRQRSLAAKEQELLSWLDSLSTPHMLYADIKHEPWAYAIFEYVEGVIISSLDPSLASHLSSDLGKLLAQIHSFRFLDAGLMEASDTSISTPFPANSSPYYEASYALFSQSERIKSRIGEPLVEKTLTFMQKHKRFFPVIDGDICLVHADFKPVNLLYDTKGAVWAIDWEFAHAGKAIIDFSILLRHRHQFPCDIAALKKSYLEHGGKLSADWLHSSLICDFVNIAFLLDAKASRPEFYQFLKESLIWTQKQWDTIDEKTLKTNPLTG